MSLFPSFIKKLQRIVNPNRFRFIIIFYNHTNEIDEVKEFLQKEYASNRHLSLNLKNKTYADIAEQIYRVEDGFVYVDEMDNVLSNPKLSAGFNQRRDKIASKNINLIMFYHKSNEASLLRNAVKSIPDLWEFRSPLLSVNTRENENNQKSSFETISSKHSSLGGKDKKSKEREIVRLEEKLEPLESKDLIDNILGQLSILYYELANYTKALEYLEQSLKIQVEIGDKSGEGTTLNNISQVYKARGDLTKALEYLEQSLKIQVEIGDKSGEGATLNNMATAYQARGDLTKALEYLEQSLKIRVEIGDKSGEGTTLNNMATAYQARGDLTKALEYLEQSLKIQVEIGDKSGEGAIRFNIGHIHYANDEVENAKISWHDAYLIAKEVEYVVLLDALSGLADNLGLEGGLSAWKKIEK